MHNFNAMEKWYRTRINFILNKAPIKYQGVWTCLKSENIHDYYWWLASWNQSLKPGYYTEHDQYRQYKSFYKISTHQKSCKFKMENVIKETHLY